MAITGIEYLFLALLTLGTGLLSAYVVYMVIKPRAERLISDVTRAIPVQVGNQLSKTFEKAAEGLDLGAIAGQLGGGEGETNSLGVLGDILGGGSGGIGDLLKLLTQFGGKKQEGGGSSGW